MDIDMGRYIVLIKGNVWIERLVVILVYAVLAKAADLVFTRVVRRVVEKTTVRFDDLMVEFFQSPAVFTVFAVGLLHALSLPPALPDPWHGVVPAFIKSAMVLAWGWALFRLFKRISDRRLVEIISRGKIGNDLYQLFHNLGRIFLAAAVVLWVLSIWKVDLTPMFASAGIAGIAVAIAAKDTLANFFGGISIFFDRTYKVGDYIIVDNSDRGEVVEIGIRSTRIKTRDDVLITIPNAILANAKIINESAPEPRFRIRIPVGVSYGSDLEEVERILLGVAADNPAVVEEPAPRVRLRAFADSSVDFELLCWIDDPALKGLATHELLKAVFAAFREKGITIPFPQRDIHVRGQETGDRRQ